MKEEVEMEMEEKVKKEEGEVVEEEGGEDGGEAERMSPIKKGKEKNWQQTSTPGSKLACTCFLYQTSIGIQSGAFVFISSMTAIRLRWLRSYGTLILKYLIYSSL